MHTRFFLQPSRTQELSRQYVPLGAGLVLDGSMYFRAQKSQRLGLHYRADNCGAASADALSQRERGLQST